MTEKPKERSREYSPSFARRLKNRKLQRQREREERAEQVWND